MSSSKHNVERLAILNSWVTSIIVALNLATIFVVVNVRAFESIAVVVFMTGTIGGAASNYRRLQEAYVQQISKAKSAAEPPPTLLLPEAQKLEPSEAAATLDVEEPAVYGELVSEPSEEPNIEKVPTASITMPSLEDKATILLLRLQIFLSPLFGGLFAFVLYGVFASGIIQGEIFPRFQHSEDEYTSPYEFVDATVPETNEDAAKALLWAFIAGFAEGFVPNFIDKLVKEADTSE
jgi:hypothetical protein